MIIKTFITCLAISFTNTICFAGDPGTDRINGGFYTAERIFNLRNNCDKYEWAGKQRNQVIERAKSWLAKSDEELWTMVPGQDLPRTIDVTFDRLILD